MVPLPLMPLAALHLKAGASLEVALSPKKDAIIVKPAKPAPRVRGRHRIEDLVAAIPKRYKAVSLAGTRAGAKSGEGRVCSPAGRFGRAGF